MELADNIGEAADYRPHTLRAELEKGRLAAQRVLATGLGLTEALGHLHQSCLVHRDVKPSNVIFVNGRPKLADIGLLTDASDSCSVVGTEGYLPPDGPGTPKADIFALGKVLYEAATGLDRRSYPDLPGEIKDWPDAAEVLEINEVVLKACALVEPERYQSCDEMRTDLQLLARGKSVRTAQMLRRYAAKSKRAGLILTGVAALGALALLALRKPVSRPAPSRDGRDSTNFEANALCDKAMYILRGDSYAELGNAYSNFQAAIALDPNFARPYAGLVELGLREDVDIPGLPSIYAMMPAYALNLERLAPNMAATHCAKSWVYWYEGNWHERSAAKAMREAEEAIKADPEYELAHSWFSWVLQCLGHPELGHAQVEAALKLAPSKSIVYRCMGNNELVARHYRDAIEWYQKAIHWEKHHFCPYWGIGYAYQALGDYAEAINYFEKWEILDWGPELGETGIKSKYEALRQAFAQGRALGYWQKQLEMVSSQPGNHRYGRAVALMNLGKTDEALRTLQEDYDSGKSDDDEQLGLDRLLFDYYWDGLHDDPRFKKLLAEVGLSSVPLPKQ